MRGKLPLSPIHLALARRHLPIIFRDMLRLPLRALLAFAAVASAFAQPVALSVNPASREEVRQFYRAVYFASESVPMSWTGSYANGNAGDTSSAFKESVRLRINFFRALAGVPADITFNPEFSVKAQQAALMMSANNALDHFPPSNWTFYTAAGAEAAANSNLAIGSTGPGSINGYMADPGANNRAVGHRRWLLFPHTRRMGTGDVPGEGPRSPANATWVIDGTSNTPRPPTRTPEVTYPPAGYVPYTLVWPRWSFSHPGADFSAASVTMTRNGQIISANIEPLTLNIGEPTLVWVYDTQNADAENPHPRPTADTPYVVNVTNVRIGTAMRNFTYTVTVFDPDVPSPDASNATISGSATPAIGATTNYTISKPTFAPAFDWRVVLLAPSNKTYTGDAGLDGLVASTTAGYSVVHSIPAIGGPGFRLAHLNPRSDQILEFPGSYLAAANSTVTFQSRLGVATSIETARVQVSTDDGVSWTDIFTQPGTSATDTQFPVPADGAFVPRTLSLAAYAGRTINVRFVYSISLSGTAFVPTASNTVGWFLDNLTLTNVQTATPAAPNRVSAGTTFGFSPSLAGPVALQARGLIAGAYPLEWGPVFTANAVAGDLSPSASYLANLSVRTTAGAGDNTLIVGFAVSGGSKPLLVRGIGPALTSFGVSGALADPRLQLFNTSSVQIAENDNWLAADAPAFRTVGAFDLAANSRDAALVTSLPSGSFTAQVSGSGGTTGVALVELYDTAGGSGTARLVNVSARSQVGTGDNLLVAGFNIAGSGPRRLLIRAVGPTLTAFNVGGALANPKLELYEGTRKIEENDDWNASVATIFPQVGAFALTPNSRDAVLLVTLPPGSYTAQISGVNNTTGVALVEVYEVP